MKRTRQHVIEDVSEDIFKAFLPAEWIFRKIPKDYGIDYEIEIVENDIVSGKRIWIQLKGTENTTIKTKRVQIPDSFKDSFKNQDYIEVEYIAFTAKTNLLKYSLQCDFPLLLGVVDISSANVYWLPLQDEITKNIDLKNPTWRDQENVTLHIPVGNNLKNDTQLYGFNWYSMEPARMRSFAILHWYHHELGYEARFSDYEIGDGYVDQREELSISVTLAKRYLTLSLEQNSLFGERGVDFYIRVIMPQIIEGIESCSEIITQLEQNTISFQATSILIGKIGQAVNLLSTCIAMYQDLRNKFILTDEKVIFLALTEK